MNLLAPENTETGDLPLPRPGVQAALVVALVLLCGGLAMRLYNFAFHPALWQDEAGLAMNIVNRDYADLGSPFLYYQACAWGFMALVKTMVVLFGDSELTLRLFPVIAGLLVPIPAYLAGKTLFNRATGVMAAALLGLGPYLSHYSAQLKPYSTDALVSVTLVFLAAWSLAEPKAKGRTAALAIAGTVAPWMSLPAIFTTGAVGIAIFVADLRRRHPPLRLAFTSLMGVAWLASFGLHYAMFLMHSSTATSAGIVAYWSEGFLPFPPTEIAHVRAYAGRFFYMFVEPGGFERRYIPGLIFLVGLWAMIRHGLERTVLVIGPFALCLAASAVGKYPFRNRLILFLLPMMSLVIAYGIDRLFRSPRRPVQFAGLLAAVVIMGFATFRAQHLVREVERNLLDLRNVMDHVTYHWREGDEIYIEDDVVWAYDYYANHHGFAVDAKKGTQRDHYIRLILGDHEHPSIREVSHLDGAPRVWFLLPTFVSFHTGGPTSEEFILDYVEQHGVQKDVYFAYDVRAYLYDMSGTGTATAAAP